MGTWDETPKKLRSGDTNYPPKTKQKRLYLPKKLATERECMAASTILDRFAVWCRLWASCSYTRASVDKQYAAVWNGNRGPEGK